MQDKIIVSNGIVFRPDNSFHVEDIAIQNGVFTDELSPDGAKMINADGFYVIPGLTDIHFHGCMGHDFCEGTEDAFKKIADYEVSVGVTTICPATMTLPENDLLNIMSAARKFRDECPAFVGIDLEGPFISYEKKGAQNPAYIAKPDINMLNRLQSASGDLIKLVAIAPEVCGAMDFIKAASNITTLSVAHTSADYETAKRAFELGARHVTHLYNAMNPIKHREPGPVIAAVERDDVDVELICDGIHVHPAVVRNTLRMFGPDRVIFISDSMEATGMPDGEYELGGQPVTKLGNKAVLADGVTIAGSVTNLMDCMRVAVREMGVPLETAIRCSAVNPVRSIGLERLYGGIEPGKVANLVALNRDLSIEFVINHGMYAA